MPTTVWFALLDDKAYVFTGLNLAKAKRIRNNPHVTLTASNFRGKPIVQSSIEAEARLMGKDEEELPNRIIDQQYGWQYRLFIGFLGSPRNLPSTSSSS